MTETVNTEQLGALHARYVQLAAQVEPLQQEMDEIKAKVRSMAPMGTVHLGTGQIVISPNRRFNPDHAATILPADLLTQCKEEVVSSKKAKRILPPALYDMCMTAAGEPKVSFK